MNKGTLRTIMYIALGVLIFSVVINLFFSILPYLLVGGAVIYVVTKVVGYFNSKKSKRSSNESTNNNYEVYVDDSVDTSNAIDVDFEDVDKHRDGLNSHPFLSLISIKRGNLYEYKKIKNFLCNSN